MDPVLGVSIVQAVVLMVSAGVVIYQTRSVMRTTRASFQHEVFKGIMDQRTESMIRTPELFTSSPAVQRMVVAAGDSPEMLARIRGMQDSVYNAYKLYQAHLLDAESWKSVSYQIASNWQSPPVAAVWDVVSQSGAYTDDFVRLVDQLRRGHLNKSEG